ncbi:unnamed protein product [Macrosiphum euphorbiae]|uniref:Uncharacterized protein n=1 Tax=Macrosiphum euphorbiae TaxID=13131 RepID=A0AAV0WTT3_9HEMI|nr:unnamed protein product [Macrosiphum euphorbiae]
MDSVNTGFEETASNNNAFDSIQIVEETNCQPSTSTSYNNSSIDLQLAPNTANTTNKRKFEGSVKETMTKKDRLQHTFRAQEELMTEM